VGRLDDGRVVFVPLGAPGDTVLVELVQQRRSFCRGELVRLLEPGPDRRDASCALFGRCGGCQWQHVRYDAQLWAKQQIVSHAVDPAATSIAAADELGYRGRARLHWRRDDRGVVLGFMRRGSREVVDVAACPLWVSAIQAGVAACRDALRVMPRGTGGTAVLLAGTTALHISLKSRGPEVARLAPALQRSGAFAGGQVVFGAPPDGPVVSFGATAVECDGLWASGGGFFQANPAQDRRLRAVVQELAGSAGSTLELFAGVGNLTRGLRAERVVAVESSAIATALLQRNTEVMHPPVTVVHGMAEEQVALRRRRGERFDLVLMDPPREGCSPALLRDVSQIAGRVVYVSCDPMTLARDLSLLAAAGRTRVTSVFVDMMPQTYHVEGVVLVDY